LRMYDLAWTEIEACLKRSRALIIPAGTCEQHGKHLPLNTDTLVTEYVADYLSEETGILVAPTLNYGVNLPCDRFTAGTCSLTEDLLGRVLTSILEWWELQGFREFYVISAHGDPFHLKALESTGRTNVRLLNIYDVDTADLLEKQRFCRHACEVETSVMLFLFPDRVRTESAADFDPPGGFRDYVYHLNTEPIEGSPGSVGYPSYATAEKGRVIVARMKQHALAWIARP